MPEGQLHCAVRHTSLRKHFIYRKATSFVYVRFSDNEVDSKLSNEVLASLIMKLCPADINEKIQVRRLGFFGRGIGIRTPTGRVRVCSANRYTIPLQRSHIIYGFDAFVNSFFEVFCRYLKNFFDCFRLANQSIKCYYKLTDIIRVL